MKTLSASTLVCLLGCILVSACAQSSASTSPSSPSAAQAAQNAEEEKNCHRSLTGPGKRKEGEDCGGSTNISCAEGLKCVSKYRCPGSIGTCQKE